MTDSQKLEIYELQQDVNTLTTAIKRHKDNGETKLAELCIAERKEINAQIKAIKDKS